jgi:hypothetical protein
MDSTENERAYIKYLEKQIKSLKKQLRRSRRNGKAKVS